MARTDIYVVYECSHYRSADSSVIKWITTSKFKAKQFYEKNKADYVEDSEWYFNLAKYNILAEEASENSNALREMELILTTENEYSNG